MSASMTQEQAAQELVMRSRLGDQNATATLAACAENAKKPGPQQATAKRTCDLAMAYIKANPVDRANVGMASFMGESHKLARVPAQAMQALMSGKLDDPAKFDYISKCCKYSNGPSIIANFLANDDQWNEDRVKAFGKNVLTNPDQVKSFVFGLKNPFHTEAPMAIVKSHPENFYPLAVGMLIGRARKIQLGKS